MSSEKYYLEKEARSPQTPKKSRRSRAESSSDTATTSNRMTPTGPTPQNPGDPGFPLKAPNQTEPSPRTPRNRLPIASPAKSDSDAARLNFNLTPPLKAAISRADYTTHLQPDSDALEKSKRSFSEISAISTEHLKATKAAKLQATEPKGLESLSFDKVKALIDAKLDVLKATMDGANHHLKWLKEQYNNGALQCSAKEFEENFDNLEKTYDKVRQMTVNLRAQKFRTIGEYMDQRKLQTDLERDAISDWAYIDLLLSRQQPPTEAHKSFHAPRDSKSQEHFRTRLLQAYGAKRSRRIRDDYAVDEAWCCIDGEWKPSRYVTAAHLVPYNTGEIHAAYLFGETDDSNGHLMSTKNGLPISKQYEELLDGADLVLVPIADTNKIKVVLLYKDAADMLKRIDGRELTFQNDMRPAKRYLYCNYAVNILRRQRYQVPHYWTDFATVGSKEVWATPGEYLRKSTLLTLAHRVGHLSNEEAEAFVANAPQSDPRSGPCSEQSSSPSKEDREVVDQFSHLIGARRNLANQFKALATSDGNEYDDNDGGDSQDDGEDSNEDDEDSADNADDAQGTAI